MIKNPKTKQDSLIKFTPWIIWLVAGLFYMFEFMHRIAPSIMVQDLMRSFNVSSQSLGSFSAYYYYAYAFAQIPVGILLDRYSTRYLLVFAASLIVIGSYLLSKTESIYIGNLSRALIGLGSAFSFVGCLKLATTWFDSNKFGLLIGLTNLLGVLGAILGGRPLAEFVRQHDWRFAMSISAVIAACFVVLLWLVIRETNENRNDSVESKTKQDKQLTKVFYRDIFFNQQVWLVAMFGSLIVVPIACYAELWGAIFLTQKYNLSLPVASQTVTLTFLGIAIGGPIVGWISDLFNKRKPIMLVGAIGALFSFSAIVYINDLSIGTLTILHVMFGFFASSMLMCFSLNSEIVPKAARGTVIAFTNTLIMGISAVFQPVTGKILDSFAKGQSFPDKIYFISSFQQAFLLLIVSLMLAILLLIKIKDKSPK